MNLQEVKIQIKDMIQNIKEYNQVDIRLFKIQVLKELLEDK